MYSVLKLYVIGLGIFGVGIWWFLDGLNGGEMSKVMGPGLIWKGPVLSCLGAIIFGYAFWITKYRYLKEYQPDPGKEKMLQAAIRDLMQIGVQPNHVEFDEAALIFSRDGTPIDSMRWDETREIAIKTTDEGPASEDVFFEFIGSDPSHSISLPQTAEGVETLLEGLKQMPGFNNQAVIDAMASTRNARFVCWKG